MATYSDTITFPPGTVTTAAVLWQGGRGRFSANCSGWNAATATLQFLDEDGVTWVPFDQNGTLNCTFTANSAGIFTSPPCQIRMAISGAVPSANVIAYVKLIRET